MAFELWIHGQCESGASDYEQSEDFHVNLH